MAEIQFYGETFTISSEPNEFALMEFADAAESVEVNSLPAFATVYRLLQEAIVANPVDEDSTDAKEWARFRLVARKNRADSEALMPVMFAVFEVATERPTGQPADSSGGLPTTPQHSASPHADQAMEMFAGRPDMQLALVRTREAISA